MSENDLEEKEVKVTYSGPSIWRPPVGPRKCGLILQVVLKWRLFNMWVGSLSQNQVVLYAREVLKGYKIEAALYILFPEDYNKSVWEIGLGEKRY